MRHRDTNSVITPYLTGANPINQNVNIWFVILGFEVWTKYSNKGIEVDEGTYSSVRDIYKVYALSDNISSYV